MKSRGSPGTSGVLQWLILGPIHFIMFRDDLDHRTERTFSKFVDDKKLRGMVGEQHAYADIERNGSNLKTHNC